MKPAIPIRFHSSFLKILTGSDLSQRRIPYMRAQAGRNGPTVWLTACCHGDEIGGIVVVQEVFRKLRKSGLKRGAIHAFPLMNPLGFENGIRHVAMSGEDLNRSFPGSASGTLAQRLANRIFAAICNTDPSLVIDLHNDWIRSIPYAVIDPPSATVKSNTGSGNSGTAERTKTDEATNRARGFAIASGLLVVEEKSPVHHSLSHSLIESGIPAITLELGESFVVNETNVAIGVRSVFSLLEDLKMIDGEALNRILPGHGSNWQNRSPSEVMDYCSTPNSSAAGIIRFLVRAGDDVRTDQPVAKIVNAFGKQRELIRAPADGIVLGLSDSSVAFPGAPVMAFALERRNRAECAPS